MLESFGFFPCGAKPATAVRVSVPMGSVSSMSVGRRVARALLVLAVSVPGVACRIGETRFLEETYDVEKASAVETCDSPFQSVELSSLEACGEENGKGHCYDGEKIALADSLVACRSPGKVCVPDEMLEAAGRKLRSCHSIIGDGACVQAGLIPELARRGKGILQKDSCADGFTCMPCKNPEANNAPTGFCEPIGVHEAACVGGKNAKVETCCHYAGVCLAPDGVPADKRDQLEQDSCSGGKLCAPAALSDGVPVKCSGPAGLSGVCLDVCFARILASTEIVLGGGSCRPTEVCLPCAIGASQGLPGCD
jgi:hypothetical protein